ncbi:hypothetical protein ACQVTX_23440 [Bacillus pretiosus]|uniref:hypothetical protein n=1 Tax=Bacillus pretiosus TaxID=2983392 RepID=UPI003D64FEC5
MKLLKEGFHYVYQKKNEGKYVSLPWNIIDHQRSELSEKIRILLREWDCPYIIQSDDDAESLLDGISDSVKSYDGHSDWLNMPSDGSDDYLLQASDNVIVHVSASDEYHGGGETEIFACISGIIVTDEVTNGEIKAVVDWIKSFK